jgi:hypothetical protein
MWCGVCSPYACAACDSVTGVLSHWCWTVTLFNSLQELSLWACDQGGTVQDSVPPTVSTVSSALAQVMMVPAPDASYWCRLALLELSCIRLLSLSIMEDISLPNCYAHPLMLPLMNNLLQVALSASQRPCPVTQRPCPNHHPALHFN